MYKCLVYIIYIHIYYLFQEIEHIPLEKLLSIFVVFIIVVIASFCRFSIPKKLLNLGQEGLFVLTFNLYLILMIIFQ